MKMKTPESARYLNRRVQQQGRAIRKRGGGQGMRGCVRVVHSHSTTVRKRSSRVWDTCTTMFMHTNNNVVARQIIITQHLNARRTKESRMSERSPHCESRSWNIELWRGHQQVQGQENTSKSSNSKTTGRGLTPWWRRDRPGEYSTRPNGYLKIPWAPTPTPIHSKRWKSWEWLKSTIWTVATSVHARDLAKIDTKDVNPSAFCTWNVKITSYYQKKKQRCAHSASVGQQDAKEQS